MREKYLDRGGVSLIRFKPLQDEVIRLRKEKKKLLCGVSLIREAIDRVTETAEIFDDAGAKVFVVSWEAMRKLRVARDIVRLGVPALKVGRPTKKRKEKPVNV